MVIAMRKLMTALDLNRTLESVTFGDVERTIAGEFMVHGWWMAVGTSMWFAGTYAPDIYQGTVSLMFRDILHSCSVMVSGSVLVGIAIETWQQLEIFSAQIDSFRSKIVPLPQVVGRKEIPNTGESGAIYRKPINQERATQYRINPDDMPVDEFIAWLYEQNASRGRLPGEDWIESNTDWVDAGKWIRTMDKFGWVSGRDAGKRKPGTLVGTSDQCIAYFRDGSTPPPSFLSKNTD